MTAYANCYVVPEKSRLVL